MVRKTSEELVGGSKRGGSPLLDFEVMKRVNSQPNVILRMAFGQSPELERLIPQIIVDRKRLGDRTQNRLKNNNRGAQSKGVKIDDKVAVCQKSAVSDQEEAAPKSNQIQPKQSQKEQNPLSQPSPAPGQKKHLI